MASGAFYRLAAWLSPAFPVGAYTYSSGIEYAVECGLIGDGRALGAWIATVLEYGAGRTESSLFCASYAAVEADDREMLAEVGIWGCALRATAEAALESRAQGEAFLAAVRAAWPDPMPDRSARLLSALGRRPAYAVAVGAVCALHRIPLDPALILFLGALAGNLVSAGVRLIPLGQTEGQRILAALEPVVLAAAAAARERPFRDIGSATVVADWASMRHETQYTRLFRS